MKREREQCSELFECVFHSDCVGSVRRCACGQIFYDNNNTDWEEGEFKKLENSEAISCDHSIGTMDIGGEEIVIGCSCDKASRYEKFIITHAIELTKYLNGSSEAIKKYCPLMNTKCGKEPRWNVS